MMKSDTRRRTHGRRGATTVEMAMVAPILLACLFAFMEFGHYYMAVNLLNGAADQAARLGISDGVSTAQVMQRAQAIVTDALPTTNVAVYVKDAAAFDATNEDAFHDASFPIDCNQIDDIELAHAQSKQLFVVRLEVDYEDIGVLGPYFVDGTKIHAQSFMRHE